MYLYIYIYIYTYIYIPIHAYIYTCIYVYIDKRTCCEDIPVLAATLLIYNCFDTSVLAEAVFI